MTDKNAKASGEKLARLREKLREKGVQAYLILHDDEWKNEYGPPCADRLAWLTGFKGSSGLAVATLKGAVVATDERYDIAVKEVTDPALYDTRVAQARGAETTLATEWLAGALPQGGKVGYDPFILSASEVTEWSEALTEHKIEMVPIEGNLIDAIWTDQPEFPANPVEVYPEKYAGKSSSDKRADLTENLQAAEVNAMLLTSPREIAWLLNIRGTDVPHVPVALSYAVAHDDGTVDWFVPLKKVSDEVRAHLGPDVRIHEMADMHAALRAMAAQGKVVAIDDEATPIGFRALLAEIKPLASPVSKRMAVKNATEIEGIKKGHVTDGVALVKFWKWIDEEAQKGKLREKDISDKLLELRKQGEGFREPSFPSIVGWAENGADIHYDGRKNALITGNGILLVDSGGQYGYGCTTDNTNAWAVGAVTDEMRRDSTRALKGHIAVARTRFKPTTKGRDLDALARGALHGATDVGLDFGHSTGHDVDAYGSVHGNHVTLGPGCEKTFEPGNVMSNEPGRYKKGQHGIRHERVMIVEENPGGGEDGKLTLRFNTVALTPFDKNLLWLPLLDEDEINWLNAYHQRVYDELSPRLDDAEKAWLKARTSPIIKEAPAASSVPLFALNPHALR